MGIIGAAIRALSGPSEPNYNHYNAHNVGTVQYVPTHYTGAGYYVTPQQASPCQRKCNRRAERDYRKAERTMYRAEMKAERDIRRAERRGGGFCTRSVAPAVVPVYQQGPVVNEGYYPRDATRQENGYAYGAATRDVAAAAPRTANVDAPPVYEVRQGKY